MDQTMKNSQLAVIAIDRPSGRLVEYRAFLAAITEPGYLEQLVSDPNKEVRVVQDAFQAGTRSRALAPKSRKLYAKPQNPVAVLGS